MMYVVILCVMCVADEAPGGALAGPAASASGLEFFETEVRPLLFENCQACHGGKKQWANLRLDSRAALLKGGDSGPALVPGKPDESLLIRAVRHTDENLKMPPENRLTDRQIETLVRWVELGAPFPEPSPKVDQRVEEHWAFLPPQPPATPAIARGDWCLTELDPFILAGLQSTGLPPAPPAARRALVRRLTYDLTGLPPTPEELDAFLTDERDDAYERLVDRLLASPAYGERWGRRWLDVARYADSNGLDENIAHGNAWRYRDYVVASFNQDKPFDQFTVEQLAGDLLPAASQDQRHEQLIATGYLSIGPKVLAEVDQAKMRMDIVDEQIDSTGRVFLGLTLGCARCHDHKFDPISTADYYGLAGIFQSTRTMDTYTKVAKWHENVLPSPESEMLQADYDRRLAERRCQIEALVADGGEEAHREELKKLREELVEWEKNPPDLPAAMGVIEDQVTDVAIQIRGNPLKLGAIVPRRTPQVLRGPAPPQFSPAASGRVEFARWLVDPRHPLTTRVLVNRVWRWHFGRGLVRTTDNFGILSERPSHPELLDWLATSLVRDGWSLKSLQRTILYSQTYRQSSRPDAQQAARDPENRLWSYFPVRRLEAEELRDSLLVLSGQLDRSFGGPALKVKNRGYLFDHTSIDQTDYSSRRRSLYLPVIRNHVYDLFQLLDFPDPAVPSGDRAATTVAPQALMMMNSDLVMQAASDFAERLCAECSDPAGRLARLYAWAYARPPLPAEIDAQRAFLRDVEGQLTTRVTDPRAREREAWGILCHVVMASNEFLYVP